MEVPRQERWDLPHDHAAVSKGRQLVREALTEWGSTDLAEDVELVVSELCTNAISYGEPPITLELQAVGRCIGGEVVDHGPLFDPPPAAELDAINGRGLHIVDALTSKWGVDPLDADAGKVVWFRLCE